MECYLPDSEINLLKKQFKLWYDSGYPDGDVFMIEVCRLLNSIPGIATVYCCESHPPKSCRAYIMLRVTAEGFSLLVSLFASIRKRFIEIKSYYPTFYCVALNFTTNFLDQKHDVILPSFILETLHYNNSQKMVFIATLIEVITDYKKIL